MATANVSVVQESAMAGKYSYSRAMEHKSDLLFMGLQERSSSNSNNQTVIGAGAGCAVLVASVGRGENLWSCEAPPSAGKKDDNGEACSVWLVGEGNGRAMSRRRIGLIPLDIIGHQLWRQGRRGGEGVESLGLLNCTTCKRTEGRKEGATCEAKWLIGRHSEDLLNCLAVENEINKDERTGHGQWSGLEAIDGRNTQINWDYKRLSGRGVAVI